MLNCRLLLCALCALASFSSSALYAEGTRDLKTNVPELLLSRGTTASVFDPTLEGSGTIGGVPTNRNEFRFQDRIPLEANKFVLAFKGSSFRYGESTLTPILTEDGVWAIAALVDQKGRPYFLSEEQLRKIASPTKDRSWGFVRTAFAKLSEGVRFDRGEIVLLDRQSSGQVVILVDGGNEFTEGKYKQLIAIQSQVDLSASSSLFRFPVSETELGYIQEIDSGKVSELLLMSNKDTIASFFPRPAVKQLSERLQSWNKNFRFSETERVECNQQTTTTQKGNYGTDTTGSVKANLNFQLLKSIGLSIGADLEGKYSNSWSKQQETVTTIKETSFEAVKFALLFGSQLDSITIANAKGCKPNDRNFFFVIAPPLSGRAIDLDIVERLSKSIGGLTWRQSGHLSTKCFSTYLTVINYLKDELDFDERVSRFVASRIMRIETFADVGQFLGC